MNKILVGVISNNSPMLKYEAAIRKNSHEAEVVAFLASPSASFITGANIDISGGQYMLRIK